MAWSEEKDSGYRLTGFAHGSNVIAGKVRASIDSIINRESLAVDDVNDPRSRPIDEIDARAVCQFVALETEADPESAAANLDIDFTAADGGSCSLLIGKMLAGSVVSIMGRRMGGFNSEQTFEQEGPLTKTWTL